MEDPPTLGWQGLASIHARRAGNTFFCVCFDVRRRKNREGLVNGGWGVSSIHPRPGFSCTYTYTHARTQQVNYAGIRCEEAKHEKLEEDGEARWGGREEERARMRTLLSTRRSSRERIAGSQDD